MQRSIYKMKLGVGVKGEAWFKYMIGLMFTLCASASVQAHVMKAQQGTLNIANQGAFLVLSLPVSAFSGIDDDGDGKLSASEFSVHRQDLARQIKQNVTLTSAVDTDKTLKLQGLLLSPAIDHHSQGSAATQLVVMGRFDIAKAKGELRFASHLFGKNLNEQQTQIRVTQAKALLASSKLTAKDPVVEFSIDS